MECSDFERSLHIYVDGTLDVSSASQIEKHLEVCDRCSREVDYLRAITIGIESYPMVEVPQDLVEDVITRIEQIETMRVFARDRSLIFKGAQMLSSGRITDFPIGFFMILYGSIKLMTRVYVYAFTSTFRRTREQIYVGFKSNNLRRSGEWVS